MNLKKLLIFQTVATLGTFLVIIAAPAIIPQSLGIKLVPQQYLLPRLIAANELALSFISFYSRKIKEPTALRLVCQFFIVFHSVTGIVGMYSLLQRASINMLANIIFRIVAVYLFYYYGLRTKQGFA